MTASVVAFVNGELGRRVLAHMAEAGGLKAVFVHPEERAAARDDIEEIARAVGARIVVAAAKSQGRVEQLRALGPVDVGVSAGYGYIMRQVEFGHPQFGTVNLHTSLLPYNRGAHPNAWAIHDGTPAGVTLHFVDRGVDTGDILDQKETAYNFGDTAATLYRKLLDDAVDLFREFWPKPVSFWRSPVVTRQRGDGSVHRVSDLEQMSLPGLDEQVSVDHLLRILRARSFPPHKGALLEVEGKRYRLRLDINHE